MQAKAVSNHDGCTVNKESKLKTALSKAASKTPKQRQVKSAEAMDDLRLIEIIKSRSHEVGVPVDIDEL
jgi:DNA polymerase III delta subunit